MSDVPSETYARALSYVLIDICAIPHGYEAETVSSAIKATMREWGYRGSISVVAVAVKNRVPATIVQLLRDNHVKVFILDSVEKQVSDDYIRHLMGKWTAVHRLPANIMIVSGDGGFARIIRHLTRKRYNCLISYIWDSANNQLHGLGSRREEWTNLLRM